MLFKAILMVWKPKKAGELIEDESKPYAEEIHRNWIATSPKNIVGRSLGEGTSQMTSAPPDHPFPPISIPEQKKCTRKKSFEQMPSKGSVSFRMGGHEGGRQDFPWLQNSILNVLKVKGGTLTPNPAIFLPETCLSSILGA